MQQAIMRSPGRITLEDWQEPEVLGDEQLLIQVTQVGVCGSDLDLFSGRNPSGLPNAIGHETGGVVFKHGRRVPELYPELRRGARVAAWAPDMEESGEEASGRPRRTPGGQGFADYLVAEARDCVMVPDGVTYPALLEPVGCVLNTVKLAAPQIGDHVVVVGATGFMGQLTTMVSHQMGAGTVIAAGRRPEALEMARSLGATHTVNTGDEDLEGAVHRILSGGLADIVYEATGVQEGLRLAGRSIRKSGKLVIAGYHQGSPPKVDVGLWNGLGLQIFNAHFRPRHQCLGGMRRAARLLASGQLDPTPLVTDFMPLRELQAAFEYAASRPRGFYKMLIEP